jgi:hypothetical protein
MRTIIAGSRDIYDYKYLCECLKDLDWTITEVISGTARGVDRLGEQWAQKQQIPIRRFPADWNQYGKRAGYIRNAEMAKNAEALVVLWDGKSPGTKSMIQLAKNAGLQVKVFIYEAVSLKAPIRSRTSRL